MSIFDLLFSKMLKDQKMKSDIKKSQFQENPFTIDITI